MKRAATAALVLALVALAACRDDAGTRATRSPLGDSTTTRADANSRVLVVGDSNIFIAGRALDQTLRKAGYDPVLVGFPGYGLKDFDHYWDRKLKELLPADPAVVVVALGTNDSFFPRYVAMFDGLIDEMMRAIGSREVIWLTHVEERPGAFPLGMPAVNQKIRDAEARWENLVVFDMAKVIDEQPELIAFDGLHFSVHGIDVYAKQITDQIDALYARCDGQVTAGCG